MIGIYNNPEEVDFSLLPEQFVIKDTLGSGGNSIIICRNKAEFDIDDAKKQMYKWIFNQRGKNAGREWVYDDAKNRIIIEEYIDSDSNQGGLIDYKFFCFNGKVSFVYGIADRELGQGAGLGIFDRYFNQINVTRMDEKPLSRVLERPQNYEEMVECAEKLSSRFPHARIDLYSQNNKIIFGEITFFDGSGYMSFSPDEFDYQMGEKFKLPRHS